MKNIKTKYTIQEWLTGCPCCGDSQECDCDLDEFYEILEALEYEEEINE
jgi:hypothetical protein